ncbi:MAG TPA: abscisic acid-deficient protein Aba4 family protein, partial [Chloroflexota bacterium]|nr:abscisic acid-deficient protein Aba4 family protein [Chloroflexota bacterium]
MSGLTYVFAAVNLLVLPCWLLMIGMPVWRGTRWLMRSPLPVAVFAAVYAGLVIPRLPTLLPLVASPRLDDVVALLGTADGATIAWVHFLALDLFV